MARTVTIGTWAARPVSPAYGDLHYATDMTYGTYSGFVWQRNDTGDAWRYVEALAQAPDLYPDAPLLTFAWSTHGPLFVPNEITGITTTHPDYGLDKAYETFAHPDIYHGPAPGSGQVGELVRFAVAVNDADPSASGNRPSTATLARNGVDSALPLIVETFRSTTDGSLGSVTFTPGDSDGEITYTPATQFIWWQAGVYVRVMQVDPADGPAGAGHPGGGATGAGIAVSGTLYVRERPS